MRSSCGCSPQERISRPVGPIQVFSSSCRASESPDFRCGLEFWRSTAPASKRLRAHSQLRIPRQPPSATLLPFCFHLLGSAPQTEQHISGSKDSSDLWLCPKCGGPMQVIERLTAAAIQLRSPPAPSLLPHETTLYNTKLLRASARSVSLCLAVL